MEATHYCINRWKSWIKNTRDFTCKRVFIYFLSCKWSQECQVRAGLGWIGKFTIKGVYIPLCQLLSSVLPHSLSWLLWLWTSSLHSRWKGRRTNLLPWSVPLKSFLEENASNDFLFHSIKPPLMAEGGTRKCNLEPENTANLNKTGILLLTRREICVLDIQQKPDYSL